METQAGAIVLTAYYNENDPSAAQWLKNLITEQLIAPGDVDTRSVVDVKADDLKGYTQCHFFAGIGGWSYALRLAGWPDERSVWTGSCPCQPFSVAGAQKGTADERHLWPAWADLIEIWRPAKIFGEQVEAAVRHGWLDLVYSDLERWGYAVGAVVIPASGVGAPHIRQRLWFVADASGCGPRGDWRRVVFAADCDADGNCPQCKTIDFGDCPCPGPTMDGYEYKTLGDALHARQLGNTERAGLERYPRHGDDAVGRAQPVGSTATPGELSYCWSDCDWLPCRDGKARPVEPGTFPLAHGVPGRVVKLRAYGNAIVPQVAAAFIRASL